MPRPTRLEVMEGKPFWWVWEELLGAWVGFYTLEMAHRYAAERDRQDAEREAQQPAPTSDDLADRKHDMR